jgi:type III pantothenate kinase
VEPQRSKGQGENAKLALMIGNSRLHWALFIGEALSCSWDTKYLSAEAVQQLAKSQTIDNFPPIPSSPLLPLSLASVVPNQTEIWQTYPNVRIITLDNVPLLGVYPTLGIDRALALWGAGKSWGFPMLVIDGGTSLTFTGANDDHYLVGGAILPGLGLQFATLAQKTGKLPYVELPQQLPQRFALNTSEAIQSGVIYTLLAGVKDFVEAWWRDFPEGNVAITGGDGQLLRNYLQSQFPEIGARLIVEPNLIFWGMGALRE